MLLYFKLVRPLNLLIVALTQYLVLYFIIRPIMLLNQCDVMMSEVDFGLFVLSNVLLAAAGYAINDYFDTRIDTINKPDKNVLLNGIPRKHANTLNFVLNSIACLLGFYCAYKVGFIKLGFLPLVVALAFYFYSLKYKRQFITGNLVVALLAAYSILVVWLFQFFAIKTDAEVFAVMVSNFMIISWFVIGFAAFAFIVTLIREIIKDIEDMDGDRADGCNTMPIKLGVSRTKQVIISLMVFTILMLAYTQLLLYRDFSITFWYLMLIQGMFVFLIIKTLKAIEKTEFHFMSVFAKIIMVAGLLSTQLLYISF